jgi:hypothetical protein
VGSPPSDPAGRTAWQRAQQARRVSLEEEADRLRARAWICREYGLTPAEHDAMTLEFLEVLGRRLRGDRDKD